MDTVEENFDFIRAMANLAKYCDDPSWLIKLWQHVPCVGVGMPSIEMTEEKWFQGVVD